MAEAILGTEARQVFKGEHGVVVARDFLSLEPVRSRGFQTMPLLARKPVALNVREEKKKL